MSNNELISRYVYAVTRLLPKKTREDVAKELSANIDEMLEARCGEVTPTETDVRVVLAELGTPDELAQKYDTDPMDHLIGGVYYFKYKIVLRIVFIAALIGSAVACLIGVLFDRDQSAFETVIEWFAGLPGMIFSAFAVITIVFMILERKKISIGDSSADNLPSIPKKNEKISIADSIVDICFAVFFTVAILGFGDVVPVIAHIKSDGVNATTVALFNMEAVQAMWIPLVLWTVMTIVRNVVRIIVGRRNMTVFIVTAVTGVISVVCAYLFFISGNVLNHEGMMEVAAMTGDAQEVIVPFLTNLGLIIFGCVAFGHLVDTITCLVYALKSKSE